MTLDDIHNAGRVLIVEDDMDFAQQTEVMLTEIDVDDVWIAASFPEAERILDAMAIDVALLDFTMGEAAGWSIAKRLCDAGTNIIVTTTHGQLTLPRSCETAAILLKPFTLNDLAALVRAQASR